MHLLINMSCRSLEDRQLTSSSTRDKQTEKEKDDEQYYHSSEESEETEEEEEGGGENGHANGQGNSDEENVSETLYF